MDNLIIPVPLDFETFNALDILVNAEIGELTLNLRRMPPDAKEARAAVERHVSRLARLRGRIADSRPPGYVEMIRATRADRGIAA